MTTSPAARISVVVVSDYGEGENKDWADERQALDRLARQDIDEPFDIILVENHVCRDSVPAALLDSTPRARLIFSQSTRSSALKNDGAAATTTPLVAVMEADCLPASDWLRRLCETIDAVPQADIVSGRTTYGQGSSLRRVFALLDRGYLDLGHAGPVRHVSNNGALYRRESLVAHPYGAEPSPFVSADIRLAEMLAAGIRPYFQPAATMVHRFDGFRFVVDLRANAGFQAVRGRILRGNLPHSRLRVFVSIFISQTRADLRSAWRAGGDFLEPLDWLLYVPMLLLVRILEWPGIARALSGKDHLTRTGYR